MSNAPLLLSSPFPDQSGIRTFDELATSSLYHIHPDLVDVMGGFEMKEALKIQSLRTTEVATLGVRVLQ